MKTYEGENNLITLGQDDIKYDAEQMSRFTDQLGADLDWFIERAHALEDNYIKYHNNETFVGKAADSSKKFVIDVQGDEFHAVNIQLKKDFVLTCFAIEDKFKDEVDSSPKARISVYVLLRIKKDFGTYYAIVDAAGYEIERRAQRLVNDYSKWGIDIVPCYRRAYVLFEEFCGTDGFVDNCIIKLKNFDQSSCDLLNNKDFIGAAQDLQTKISNVSGVLNSMTVYQPNMAKQSVSLISLSTAAGWNPFKSFFGPSDKTKTYTETEYIKSMKELYGFSEEDSKLIYEAYTKFKSSSSYSKVNNQSNIWRFYGYMASLFPKYSGDDKKFKLMGNLPTSEQAISFFDSEGLDGNKIKEVIINQHENCGDKRDFVHECAIMAIMSSDTSAKAVSRFVDNPDALVGYKGDIYSGSMGMDDMKSDVAAVNIYHRMRFNSSKKEDFFQQMVNYNIEAANGSINEAEEFLRHYDNANTDKGLEKLKKEMNRESIGTDILSEDVDEETIKERKKEFIDFLEEQLD